MRPPKPINYPRNFAIAAIIVFGGNYVLRGDSAPEETVRQDRNETISSYLDDLDTANPAAGDCVRASMATFASNNESVSQSNTLMWAMHDCLKSSTGFDRPVP